MFIYSKILQLTMVANKLIKVTEDIKNKLDKLKIHPRETYNDLLMRLIKDERDKQGSQKRIG